MGGSLTGIMDSERLRAVCPDLPVPWSQDSSSLTDLEKAFVHCQSLSGSTLSQESQTSSREALTSRSDIVVEYAGVLVPQFHSPSLQSPSRLLDNLSLQAQETLQNLSTSTIPLDSKSSTPFQGEHPKKVTLQSSPNLSCSDFSVLLSAAQPHWEISLIRSFQDSSNSPMQFSPLDVAESTWSPLCNSGLSFAESFSLPCAGVPPQSHLGSELQRSWKESVTASQVPSLTLTLPPTDGKWKRHT
ncbi:uncharacterized protein LOC136748649 [Amia ocellicauda]|uniref:uncharacterized protein LOC136748649 n=1 Tax=Amia ocellicauda TaxID=2972642 RepID=UPI00346389E7